MYYPPFFDEVEPIEVIDPLAGFLGAFEEGFITLSYIDVVKLAGHSCPTVAGAWLMAKLGLERLFLDTRPLRSEIEVFIKGAKNEGVNGVIGNVIAYICGAGDEGGFKGIGPRYNRANKLHFGADIPKEVRLVRIDSGEKVDLRYNPSVVAPHPDMQPLMQKIMQGVASIEEEKRFRTLWQERVAKILLSKELWPKMVEIA